MPGYLMCFSLIYVFLLKSFPEILGKCERNLSNKCVIFSSDSMSDHFLKDPFQILLQFKLISTNLNPHAIIRNLQ